MIPIESSTSAPIWFNGDVSMLGSLRPVACLELCVYPSVSIYSNVTPAYYRRFAISLSNFRFFSMIYLLSLPRWAILFCTCVVFKSCPKLIVTSGTTMFSTIAFDSRDILLTAIFIFLFSHGVMSFDIFEDRTICISPLSWVLFLYSESLELIGGRLGLCAWRKIPA